MEDWAFALTVAAIRARPEEMDNFFNKCKKHRGFELEEISVPSRYSVGFRFKDNTDRSFIEGVKLLRKSQIEDFVVGIYDYSDNEMPEQISGAFLGTSRLVLVLKTKDGARAFSTEVELDLTDQVSDLINWSNIWISEEVTSQNVKPLKEVELVENDLVQVVIRARSFSEEMNTPFTEAFALALFFLQNPDLHHLRNSQQQMDEGLKQLGFSELGVQISQEYHRLLDEFVGLSFDFEVARRVIAFAVLSDLFGSMGSWNDQVFDTDIIQSRYLEISDSLYKNAYDFFVATLNDS